LTFDHCATFSWAGSLIPKPKGDNGDRQDVTTSRCALASAVGGALGHANLIMLHNILLAAGSSGDAPGLNSGGNQQVSVARLAKAMPPITARPSGAF